MKLSHIKISSNQIIIAIVAFLVGVAATNLVLDNKKGKDISDVANTGITEEQANEPVTGDETTGEAVTPGSAATKTGAVKKPSSGFVTGKCNTGLSGRKDDKLNAIVLNWSPCASGEFQFYKLVKSSKNPSPSYPADGVAFSSPNKNVANFVDRTVASRTTYYYRMCVIERLGQVSCSNVATVSF